MKIMMGSVRIMINGRIRAVLSVSEKGSFSSSSRVQYLSSPVSFRSLSAFLRRRTCESLRNEQGKDETGADEDE